MADPISLFDSELIPFGWFDAELTAESWFDIELPSYSFVVAAHSVYYIYSHDEGITWFSESLIGISMIDFFTATNHQNDDRFRCWFQFDAGTAGPGKAYGQYRRHTDAAWSASFQFKNGGVALSIADSGMCNVAPAFSGQGEWTFSPTINGDSSPSTWFSNDEGRTWRLQV